MSRNRHHHNPRPEQTFLTPGDQERIAMEILEQRGHRGLTEPELADAVSQVEEFCFAAALWRLWTDGQLTFGLTPDGELTFHPPISTPDG